MRKRNVTAVILLLATIGLLTGFVPSTAQEPTRPDVLKMDVRWLHISDQWLVVWEFVIEGMPSGTFSLTNARGVIVCDGIGTETTCDCDWVLVDGGGWAACEFQRLSRFRVKGKGLCEVQVRWTPGSSESVILASWRGPCKAVDD